jgi:hypothetical protein
MMGKHEALKAAVELWGKTAFVVIRKTMDANTRKGVGYYAEDGQPIEIGRGRTWDAAFDSAVETVAAIRESTT